MKTTTKQNETANAKGVNVKANLKAGLFDVFRKPKPSPNHNQTLIREAGGSAGLKVKTNVKAGDGSVRFRR